MPSYKLSNTAMLIKLENECHVKYVVNVNYYDVNLE